MNNKILLTILAIFIANTTMFAQWTQLTSGTTNMLNAVFFPTTDTGYVVGELGTILKTTDGGVNWIPQTSGTTSDLNDIFFINANYGYAVGGGGIEGNILRTTNGGDNWTIINGGPHNLTGVFFNDDSTGYVSGLANGNIYKTNDSCNTLSQKPCVPNAYILRTLFFTSIDTGYVAGDAGILKTTDGGNNWVQQSLDPANNLHFPSRDTGYGARSDGTVLKTTDGGINWSIQLAWSNYLSSVFFTDVNTGYIVGGDPVNGFPGIILKTINGGNNWTIQTNPISPIFYSVYFTSTDTGYVVGANGTILKTTNGGVVGIPESYEEENFHIYPNPSSNSIKISYNELKRKKYVLDIFNSLGEKMINQENIKNKDTIDIEKLKEGIYYVVLSSGTDYNKILKFVKIN